MEERFELTEEQLKQIGENIKALREHYAETQEELGDAVELTGQAISMMEAGKRIKFKRIQAISQYYGVSLNKLVNNELLCTVVLKKYVSPQEDKKTLDIIFPYCKLNEKNEDKYFRKGYKVLNMLRHLLFDEQEPFVDNEKFFDIVGDGVGAFIESAEKNNNYDALINALYLIFIVLIITPSERQIKEWQALIRKGYQIKKLTPYVMKKLIDTKENNKLFRESYQEETRPFIVSALGELKNSEYRDFAEYLTALFFISGTLSSGEGQDLDNDIGIQLLLLCNEQGNQYSDNYLKRRFELLGL